MVVTECKNCRRRVWRGMDGAREELFEPAHGVYRFSGNVQSGLAVAMRVVGLYRVHVCRTHLPHPKHRPQRSGSKSLR